ncbi:LutC/YkgG family protein [Rufibacter tibetensis]|uniref:Lactate utilization protein B/C n=1 Tax=Rufibacter tibetensis TaxID=512763 RepID=A0A0P0C8Y1_9BACT|nr:LUD domain-containing protein [Rufibacter tibetensis]ALI97820.1 lactate utilization protein B/C [Rufibacter tibetensis]
MSSRERILAAVSKNQPALTPMPGVPLFQLEALDLVEKFSQVAVSIGSGVFQVKSYEEVQDILANDFKVHHRIISHVPELASFADTTLLEDQHRHKLENVDLAIVKGHFGVAENGASWVTEDLMGLRVVPFICQHLAIILPKDSIVPLMHDAYEKIGTAEYGYGVFIAGPSKTADIEQSLVLGAHGPRTLSVFLMG